MFLYYLIFKKNPANTSIDIANFETWDIIYMK